MPPIKRFLWLTCATLSLACATNTIFAQVTEEGISGQAQEPGPAPTRLEEGVIHEGRPAVAVRGPSAQACFVVMQKAKDGSGPGFVFSVLNEDTFWLNDTGNLVVTADKITFEPDNPKFSDHVLAFPRSEASGLKIYGLGAYRTKIGGPILHGRLNDRSYDFSTRCAIYRVSASKETRKASNAAADQAEGMWAQWLNLAISNFAAAEQKFRALTVNASVPLSGGEQATVTSKQIGGDAAAQAGKLYDALQDYEAALQALPAQWAPQDVEQPLREKIIKLVLRMDPRPAIPREAMQHLAYAETAFQEAKGPADLDNAIQELNQALRLAPWWGDAYKNLGLLLEKADRYADAARNLQLYLLATPDAPDAQSVQMKVYSLQYKAKQQEASN